jgi:hypothetical protein
MIINALSERHKVTKYAQFIFKVNITFCVRGLQPKLI